ncbi:MAG TPA: adenosine deaminase [Actinomycetota bacterium]|nr:adenosine deaminase [Actinomycetota bacterium]
MDPQTLAKIDLHRHLEGAVRLQTILDLYREAGEPLPETTPDELAPRAQVLEPMDSLEAVLDVLELVRGSFRTYDAIERISAEAVEDLARDQVRLGELRFSPEFFFSRFELDWDLAMERVVAGVRRASAEHDVAVGLIAIFSRDFGIASGRRTVSFARQHREDLVGFDIAGDELPYPPALYVELLASVHEAGLPVTVHYGESGPSGYPRDAILQLQPARLAHGVSVGSDAEATALAKERGVGLDMCPTSNLRTRAVDSLAVHPALRLLRDDLLVTINTDDPGLFGIDLTHEWQVARSEMGFTLEDLRTATANALRTSFLPDEVKNDVRARHFGWLDDA